MSKVYKIIFFFAAFVSLLSCVDGIDGNRLTISFKSEKYDVVVGEVRDFYYDVKIVGDAADDPVFSSSDQSVASITSEGLLTGMAPGEAVITAELGGRVATCVVSVQQLSADRITLKYSERGLTAGFWGEIVAEVNPKGYDPDNLLWTISPTKPDLKYQLDTVSNLLYKVRFEGFVEDAGLKVSVKDKNSNVWSEAVLKVLEAPTIGAVALSLSPAELTVPMGTEAFELEVDTAPSSYDRNIISWTSSDENVVSVHNGVLTFNGVGSAVITAKDGLGELTAASEVNVIESMTDADITEIRLDQVSVSKKVGDGAFQLIASCYTGIGEAKTEVPGYNNLEWSVKAGGDNAVEVSQLGVVTIVTKEGGISEVVVSDKKNKMVRATCQVHVSSAEVVVTDVFVTSAKTVRQGQTFNLEPLIYPENAKDKSLIYKSDNPQVATVSPEGEVTAVSEGEAEILVMASSGVSAKCALKVITSRIEASSVTLNVSDLYLDVQQEYTLSAIVGPEEATDKTLVWTSTDESVATVSDGKVSTLKEGEADIVATAGSVSARCRLVVSADAVSVNDRDSINVVKKQTVRLSYAPQTAGAVTWKVKEGNEFVALEPATGLLIAKVTGSAKVAAVVGENEEKVFKVNVTPLHPTKISINPQALVMCKGAVNDLDCVFEPSDCDYREVTWKSWQTSIVSVDEDGKVKAGNAIGTARIQATSIGADGKEIIATCLVNVEATKHSVDLRIVSNSVVKDGLPQEQSVTIRPFYSISGASSQSYEPSYVEWNSYDESLAVVDQNGVVTNVAEYIPTGEKKTVKIEHIADGVRKTIEVPLRRAVATGIRFIEGGLPAGNTMFVDETFTFKAEILPAKADQVVKWIVSNGAVDYDSGLYDPRGFVGQVNIDAYVYDQGALNIKTTETILVKYRDIQSATLNYTEQKMKNGQTMYLFVEILPASGTSKQVRWSSSDENVAVVNQDGKVVALAEGTAVITAELHDGRKLTCDLTVEYDPLNIQVGDYYYSDGTASPELIEGKTVVGVVFLKDNITFQDARLRADYPDCVNGLVMALKDSSSVCWQSEASDVSGWAVKNGYPTLKGASSNYAGKYITDAGKLYSGYSNTMALKAYAEAEGKTVELGSNLPQTRPAENASVWFVPSLAELLAVPSSDISRKLVEAGGDPLGEYWVSNENEGVTSWALTVNPEAGSFEVNISKSQTKKIRHIFAF